MSDSLQPHGLQHARPPCPSPTPRAYSNSCPSSRWCHLILCRPLLLLSSIFPSIRVFSSESVLHIRWPEYWGFGFSISPSNEYLGLISFRMDWLEHHSSKTLFLQLQRSAFFTVQLSHPYRRQFHLFIWLKGSGWVIRCSSGCIEPPRLIGDPKSQFHDVLECCHPARGQLLLKTAECCYWGRN